MEKLVHQYAVIALISDMNGAREKGNPSPLSAAMTKFPAANFNEEKHAVELRVSNAVHNLRVEFSKVIKTVREKVADIVSIDRTAVVDPQLTATHEPIDLTPYSGARDRLRDAGEGKGRNQ
jgi:hypothetical protein